MAFGRYEDPFRNRTESVRNIRFAVGRRAAEVRLVTVEDVDAANRAAAHRRRARESPDSTDR